MSRKVGLGDTHFDPDIDGDVDFDFFGGVDAATATTADDDNDGQECDLIQHITTNSQSCHSSNTISNDVQLHAHSADTSMSMSNQSQIHDLNKSVTSGAVDPMKSSVVVVGEALPPAVEEGPIVSHHHISSSTAATTTSSVDDDDEMSETSGFSLAVNAKDHKGKVEAIDMKLLSQAVSELRLRDEQLLQHSRCQRRVTSSGSRGGSLDRPVGQAMVARPRKNMTFSNDEVRRIDLENKLLLKKIIQAQKPSRTSVGKQMTTPPLIASSAINRMREFKKIESENMLFLKRLQAVKPTKALSRDHLVGCGSRNSGRVSEFDARSSCASLLSSQMNASRRRTRTNSSSSLPSWTGTGSGSIVSSNLSSQTSSNGIKLPKLIAGQTLINSGSD